MSTILYGFALIACLFRLTPGEKNRIITIQQTRFYEDKERLLTFDQFILQPADYLAFNADFVPADYNHRAAYWVELDFCITGTQENYVLEFYDQTIDSIDVFLRHESDTVFSTFQLGDHYQFADRQYAHKNFELPLKETGQYLVYVRLVSHEYADIRVSLRPVSEFVNYALMEYYLYGIFYGMILIISLYNTLIYFAIREVKYLYYTFYILSVGLYAMCVDGIAYQMLWPTMPRWNAVASGYAMFALILGSIVFSKRFLNLNIRAPKINRLLSIVLILRSGFFLYCAIVDPRLFSFRSIEMIPLLLIFIGGIQVLLRGYKPARFFVVAYGFLFMGFIIKALLMYSILPFRMFTYSQTIQILSYYSLHICFLLEMLFLSVALSDRVRVLKSNRDRAHRRIIAQHEESILYKDRLNFQLEKRIKARTSEIEEKNQLLEQTNETLSRQKREIAEINSLLDLDNWKLRNNLKSAQTNRLLNRTISFQDFEQIFPDQESGLKYMANHKWGQAFECKRCRNDRFTDGPTPYSRRCTKCGFNETPTSETVFHALKFPLNKAMYVLYLWLVHDERSLSVLQNEMNLRKNTIWAMRKKIDEHHLSFPEDDLNIFRDLELVSFGPSYSKS